MNTKKQEENVKLFKFWLNAIIINVGFWPLPDGMVWSDIWDKKKKKPDLTKTFK